MIIKEQGTGTGHRAQSKGLRKMRLRIIYQCATCKQMVLHSLSPEPYRGFATGTGAPARCRTSAGSCSSDQM